jgi:small subunit ribosomal protein S3
MGQKTNPIGNRLGYIRGWDSNWYADKEYAANVIEDEKLRQYLGTRIEKGGIARIIIERTLKRVTLTIHTSRPVSLSVRVVVKSSRFVKSFTA